MKLIIITGKQCAGKTTLANFMQYFHDCEKLDNNAESGVSAIEKFEYGYHYEEVTDEETGEVCNQMVIDKASLGVLGIETPTEDKNYVCIARPQQIAPLRALYDCFVVWMETDNNIIRKMRYIGDGNFDNEIFGIIDSVERQEFKNVDFDFKMANRSELDLQNRKEILDFLSLN